MPWKNTGSNGSEQDPIIVAKGQTFTREIGESLADAVNDVASSLGLNKFDVFVNQDEVTEDEAGDMELAAGDIVKLQPHDVAA